MNAPTFKPGDLVIPKRANHWVMENFEYVVVEAGLADSSGEYMIKLSGVGVHHYEWFFELAAIVNSPLNRALK